MVRVPQKVKWPLTEWGGRIGGGELETRTAAALDATRCAAMPCHAMGFPWLQRQCPCRCGEEHRELHASELLNSPCAWFFSSLLWEAGVLLSWSRLSTLDQTVADLRRAGMMIAIDGPFEQCSWQSPWLHARDFTASPIRQGIGSGCRAAKAKSSSPTDTPLASISTWLRQGETIDPRIISGSYTRPDAVTFRRGEYM